MSSSCDSCLLKNEESTWRAISVGGITIRSLHLPNRGHCFPKSVIIRITDISKDTAYTAIQSVCKTIGTLEGMARTREDAIDVFFSLKDYSEAQNILKE